MATQQQASILASVRQNFDEACEAALNAQVNLELQASYFYLGVSAMFGGSEVALKGFSGFFEKQSLEEREHANRLLEYINKRGGRISLSDVKAPVKFDYKNALDALRAALQLERDVNESLLKLHALAEEKRDPHMAGFIETNFLDEQVESIKQLADYITNLSRAASNEFQFERLSLLD